MHAGLHRQALPAALLLAGTTSSSFAEWTVTIERPKTDPKRSNLAFGWIPDGCKVVRGVFITQHTMFEAGMTRNEEIRAACAEKGLAIVYALCGIGSNFITGESGANLEAILAAMAKATNHPELEFAPLITAVGTGKGRCILVVSLEVTSRRPYAL